MSDASEVERVFRRDYGRAVASVNRLLGDLGLDRSGHGALLT